MRIPGGQGPRFDRDAQVNRDEVRTLRARLQQIERDNPRLLGRVIEDVPLVVGANEIEHDLKVKGVRASLRGWEVVSDDARPVFVQAYRNAAWTLNPGATANTYTQLIPDVVVTDFGGDYDAATGTVQLPHIGLYTCNALGWYSGGAAGDLTAIATRFAGTSYRESSYINAGTTSSGVETSGIFSAQMWAVTFWMYMSTAAARAGQTGQRRTSISVRSDETLTGDQANSSDPTRYLRLYSARTRTVTLRVW
jgi:hypothetical protein